jgi:hypothetical protein
MLDHGIAYQQFVELAKRFYLEDGTRKPDHYWSVYAGVLGPLRYEPLRVLELGTYSGASTMVLRNFFPCATIVTFDIQPIPVMISQEVSEGRLHFIGGDQSDTASLARCLGATGGEPFDVIIDDASHIARKSKASFDWLFPHALSRSGHYFLEDFGTGYISGFPDGAKLKEPNRVKSDKEFPSHEFGMVGWLKTLIDEMHIGYLVPGASHSEIESIQVWPSIALAKKR